MGSILIGVVIAAAVIGIIVWMIKNGRNGKSFCGAELPEPLNTSENLVNNKR
ncbi:MAG: FeoB-associated Cys-rich membrane protein [Acetatifactor muris]|nr:FeoB-associated Cys-rich membrane protein [Acetatifactor muris]